MSELPAVDRLMLQMLTWIDDQPRTYRQTMDAWKSSCPRFPVWEDALRAGLVAVDARGKSMHEAMVLLTDAGRKKLQIDRTQQPTA